MQKKKTFPVRYSKEDHATVKRRAEAAGVSLHQFILDMTIHGKVQRKK